MVYRYLEQKRPQGTELARAFYLLGQTEAFTRRSFELPDTEYYLEQAIRLAPHPARAQRVRSVEGEVVLGYTGSAGEQLPEEIQDLLRELAELSRVDSAQTEVTQVGARESAHNNVSPALQAPCLLTTGAQPARRGDGP
jgi:hypothetical protein